MAQRLDAALESEAQYRDENVACLDDAQLALYEAWRARRLRRVLKSEVSALLRSGAAFEHTFTREALGLELALVAAGGRTWVAIERVRDSCELRDALEPFDEILAVEGVVVEPPDEAAFQALCELIAGAPRPLTLTLLRRRATPPTPSAVVAATRAAPRSPNRGGVARRTSDGAVCTPSPVKERCEPDGSARRTTRRIVALSWDAARAPPSVAELRRFFGAYDFVVAAHVAGHRALVLVTSERAARDAVRVCRRSFPAGALRARVLGRDRRGDPREDDIRAKTPGPTHVVDRIRSARKLQLRSSMMGELSDDDDLTSSSEEDDDEEDAAEAPAPAPAPRTPAMSVSFASPVASTKAAVETPAAERTPAAVARPQAKAVMVVATARTASPAVSTPGVSTPGTTPAKAPRGAATPTPTLPAPAPRTGTPRTADAAAPGAATPGGPATPGPATPAPTPRETPMS